MEKTVYLVYNTTHETLKAESLLRDRMVKVRPVIKPVSIKSSCGMALEISEGNVPDAENIHRENSLSFLGFYQKGENGWERGNYGGDGKNKDKERNTDEIFHNSHESRDALSMILPPRGDYQNLISYQMSEVIYQITYRFCQRFLKKGDRTIDQMVQAARSGKQNIVEGSKAATTSKEMEIKLTNVARASLEELLEDYRDYLRVRDLPLWKKQSREAAYARKLGMSSPLSFEAFREFVETRPDDVVANIAICLIHQANYLLDQQLKALGMNFLKEGGLRERMTQARLQARDRQKKGQ